MIRLVGKRGKGSFESQLDDAAKGMEFVQIDCTSGNKDEVMRGLSPFYLGPVECYDGLVSQTFERAWQCSKVFAGFADSSGNPLPEWFTWRDRMWADASNEDHMAIRFPAGRENANAKKTLYSYWKVDGEFKRLGYIDARKHIYLPVYAKAVVKTEAYRRLCAMRDEGRNLLLVDFDGYNIHHPKYGFTYNDAIHCPLLKMGHGFVLAMLLEGVIKVDEGGNVIYADGLMDDPHKVYSTDLRKLTDEQKLDRAASCAGVTADEFQTLSDADRKMLKRAYSREACKARGIARAAWARLPLAEKLRVAQLEEQRHEPVAVMKEAAVPEKVVPEVADTVMARPSDLTGYFNAGTLADATGAIPGWVATERSDIVRLWVPKTVLSIGSFAFKGCANLEEIVFEASPDGADQSIGTMAFAGCPKLGKVLLSGSVRSIGAGAFRDDGALTTLKLDPIRQQILVGPHAFDNCPAPDGLQKQIATANICAKDKPVSNKVKNKPVLNNPMVLDNVSTSGEFDAFWDELADWFGALGGEEFLAIKKGSAMYTLKCGWSAGTLVVAMVAPWAEEWDYVQLYRGMFGWGNVGAGFYSQGLRIKAAKLLLDEMIRRNEWMQALPDAAAQRDRELLEERAKIEGDIQKIEKDIASLEEKKVEMPKEDYDKKRELLEKFLNGAKGEYNRVAHQWFAKYRWLRNRMETQYEGDMRLYVKGCNRLFGSPIQCHWALSDMRRKSKGSSGRRQADSSRASEKSAAEEGADSRPTPRGDIFFGEV